MAVCIRLEAGLDIDSGYTPYRPIRITSSVSLPLVNVSTDGTAEDPATINEIRTEMHGRIEDLRSELDRQLDTLYTQSLALELQKARLERGAAARS